MKPFLLLQLRPVLRACENEYKAFLKYSGLPQNRIHRIQMNREMPMNINLDEYAGVICGGGPSNVSDPPEKKKDYQRQFETTFFKMLEEIVRTDFPYFGTCYGLGALAHVLGAKVGKEKYGEEVGAVWVSKTTAGVEDPLLKGIPDQFEAFVGHKEAVQFVPEGSELLAGSEICPVQMIRNGQHVYATQFHPELDAEGLTTRINIYKHEGYFPPETAQEIINRVKDEKVIFPEVILKNFINRYK